MKTLRSLNRRGFTLVEILAIVAGISILAGSGYMAISNVGRQAEESKLESDVATINRALDAYEASGGNRSSITGVDNALDRLKSAADSDSRAKMSGLKSSFLDKRVDYDEQSDEEAATGQPRARWNTTSKRFEVASSGSKGVKRFRFDEEAATESHADEARSRTKDIGTETKWVWDYSDTAPPALTSASEPTTTGASSPGGTLNRLTALSAPNFSPPAGTYALADFDPGKPVSISNPNPAGSSQIYYSTGGPYQLYASAVSVPPGSTLTAVAITQDPNLFTNSSSASAAYTAIPVQLTLDLSGPSSVTYQQAGGSMGPGSIPVSTPPPLVATMNAAIPASFASKYEIRYTLDGSDPVSNGAIATIIGNSANIPYGYADWGAGGSLNVRAVAVSNDSFLTTSAVSAESIAASKVTLAAPKITPESGSAGDAVSISRDAGQVYPQAFALAYTTDGTNPVSPGSTTSEPILVASAPAGTIKAAVFAPTLTNWFNASGVAAAEFVAGSGGDMLPVGMLVGSVNVGNSGTIKGSVTIASVPSQEDVIISGAAQVQGNMYLPGTPTVYVGNTNSNNSWTPARDGRTSWPAFSDFIKGNEYDSDGNIVSPSSPGWSPAPRVVDLSGDANPTDYYVLLSGSAMVQGKVYRRIAPATLPVVAAPAPKANNNSVNFGWAADPNRTVDPNPPTSSPASFNARSNAIVTAKPGNYGAVSVQNTAKLILGDADNPNNVQYYTFDSLELSGSSSLQIVGKVVITINYSTGGKSFKTSNSVNVGNSAHPDWLQLNVYSSAPPSDTTRHVEVSGAGNFYGQVNAPTGLAKIGNSGMFRGSITAYKSDTDGAGNVVLDLSPISG